MYNSTGESLFRCDKTSSNYALMGHQGYPATSGHMNNEMDKIHYYYIVE